MSIRGRQIEVNGVTLNVYDNGEGEPVMLLHGFPDSNYLWRGVIPNLVDNGYRVVAPDQRGFGGSDAPEGIENYDVETIAKDALAVLDELKMERVRLVAHDWGAMVGWLLAGGHPERFKSYVAISMGHPSAYASAGFEQKRKGWYVQFFQPRGVAEQTFMEDDWATFRRNVNNHPETAHWIQDLSRPGRLSAAMDWYRANFSRFWQAEFPRVTIPVFGIWSTEDMALAEGQMIGSAAYVDASWQYERLEGVSHWIPIDCPEQLSDLILTYYERK